MNDWNELDTKYSYRDKVFLNSIWSKYGAYHFKSLLYVIDQMHIKSLLSEVLISLSKSLEKLKVDSPRYRNQVYEREAKINKIITKAYLNFSDEIKSDIELTQSFESFLNLLVEIDMEEAAVILDEFRVH